MKGPRVNTSDLSTKRQDQGCLKSFHNTGQDRFARNVVLPNCTTGMECGLRDAVLLWGITDLLGSGHTSPTGAQSGAPCGQVCCVCCSLNAVREGGPGCFVLGSVFFLSHVRHSRSLSTAAPQKVLVDFWILLFFPIQIQFN